MEEEPVAEEAAAGPEVITEKKAEGEAAPAAATPGKPAAAAAGKPAAPPAKEKAK